MPAWLFGRPARVAVALCLVLLGFESVVSTATAWLSGARNMISTGIALPVAGIALLLGSGTALRVTTSALRIQFVVSVVATSLVVVAAWPGKEPVALVPAWPPVAVGLLHLAVAAGGLMWTRAFCRSRARRGIGG